MQDFISQYIDFASEGTESPKIFHRWSIITTLAAFLSRQYNVRHGHNIIQPNLYVMLIGSAGSRKSTAIKMAVKLLKETGYSTFASEKTTKEKFLMDLAGLTESGKVSGIKDIADILDNNLWLGGEADEKSTTDKFIAADEFNDFFGNDILSFVSMLGVFWDYNGIYSNSVKNGQSVNIPNPTINIIGGTTPATFATTFPQEIIGQGFFSRTLLIYGERSDKRFAFPEPPDETKRAALLEQLAAIKQRCFGTVEISGRARSLLEKIYNQPLGFDDFRFESYGTRRFTQLLKLCLIVSASRCASNVDECDVVYANTILSHAEQLMPKALGEFGRAKNADVTHKVLQIIYTSQDIVNFKYLWSILGGKDFDKAEDLGRVIQNLLMAGKIQNIDGVLLPNRRAISFDDDQGGTVNWELLSDEEKDMST